MITMNETEYLNTCEYEPYYENGLHWHHDPILL